MQKVGVIRSIRCDIKAEKKDKEKNKETDVKLTNEFHCSILNFGCQSVIMIFIFFFPTGL